MNENTKVLSIIAVVLGFVIFLYEAKEYRVQAQEMGPVVQQQDAQPQVQVQVPTVPVAPPAIKVEPQIDMTPAPAPQRRILRQPILRRGEPQGYPYGQGGCSPCQPYGGQGGCSPGQGGCGPQGCN